MSKNGKGEKTFAKNRFCDHNEKLASRGYFYFFYFVMIKKIIFTKKNLGDFCVTII